MWSMNRRTRKEPQQPSIHPESVYVLSVIEYHHQANNPNGSGSLLGGSHNSLGSPNNSFSVMDIGGVHQYQSYNHNRNYQQQQQPSSSPSYIDDGTITTSGAVPPSFRTLGVFENKDDAVIQLPKFKTQTGDMAFPHRHVDPGTLFRRHRIVINIDNRDNVPDHGIILELEYNDGYCKRRDQVCISKMPYFPYKPKSTTQQDNNMREINIIDLRQQNYNFASSGGGGGNDTVSSSSSSSRRKNLRKARSSNTLM